MHISGICIHQEIMDIIYICAHWWIAFMKIHISFKYVYVVLNNLTRCTFINIQVARLMECSLLLKKSVKVRENNKMQSNRLLLINILIAIQVSRRQYTKGNNIYNRQYGVICIAGIDDINRRFISDSYITRNLCNYNNLA